ncbi:MAG: 50S ribosomal protein L21 [Actinomycetota bacterium]
MYAVIRTGGKQYRVAPGDVVEIELLASSDGAVTFTPLLVVDDAGTTHVGKDLAKATVKGRLQGETKGDKVRIFKYRNKTGYARRAGHRQRYALVEITDISLGAKAVAAAE